MVERICATHVLKLCFIVFTVKRDGIIDICVVRWNASRRGSNGCTVGGRTITIYANKYPVRKMFPRNNCS